MVKEHEVTGVLLLKDNKHQVTTPSRKEDNTDFTATETTTDVNSVCESEQNDYITEGLAETITLNDQIYVFGKRRWVKPVRKWRTPLSQVCKEKEQSMLDMSGNLHTRTIKGVFMFGSAARTVTETKCPLPAMQELPIHQKFVGNQVKTTKKPGRWSRFGKFRVETKKTQGPDHMGHTTKKRRKMLQRQGR